MVDCVTQGEGKIGLLVVFDVVLQSYLTLALDPGANVSGVERVGGVYDQVGVLHWVFLLLPQLSLDHHYYFVGLGITRTFVGRWHIQAHRQSVPELDLMSSRENHTILAHIYDVAKRYLILLLHTFVDFMNIFSRSIHAQGINFDHLIGFITALVEAYA